MLRKRKGFAKRQALSIITLQGYLTYKKMHPPTALP